MLNIGMPLQLHISYPLVSNPISEDVDASTSALDSIRSNWCVHADDVGGRDVASIAVVDFATFRQNL